MTISSGYIGETFSPGAGAAEEYDFIFETIGASTVVVSEQDAAGDLTLLVQGVDYTVVVNGNAPIYAGGTVTMLRSHTPGTVQVNVARETPTTQLVDYQPYTPFPAETHEFALDKLTMVSQELKFDIAFFHPSGVEAASQILQIAQAQDDLRVEALKILLLAIADALTMNPGELQDVQDLLDAF